MFNPWVMRIRPEEKIATHSSILAWKIPWDSCLEKYHGHRVTVRRVTKNQTQLSVLAYVSL